MKYVALNFNKYIFFYAALASPQCSITLFCIKLSFVGYSLWPSFLLQMVKTRVFLQLKFNSTLQEVSTAYYANVPFFE